MRAFFARAGWQTALALCCLAAVATLGWQYLPGIRGSQDTGVYERIGRTVQHWTGEEGATLDSEYPPLATTLFSGVTSNPFRTPFEKAWLLTLLLAMAATCGYVLLGKKGKSWPSFYVPLALLATTLLFSQELVFARYDIFVGLLLLLAWNAHDRERHAQSGFFLLIAAGIKVLPLFLVPLFLLATPRRSRLRWSLGALAGAAAAVLLPLLILGPAGLLSNLTYFLEYQSVRGFQAESTWSLAHLLFNALRGVRDNLQYHHLALHNMEMGTSLAFAAEAIAAAGAVVLAYIGWKKPARYPLTSLLPSALLWLLLTLPILSPQYFLWLFPLLIVRLLQLSASPKSFNRAVAMLLLAVFIGTATHWVYPSHYGQFADQQRLSLIFLLNARTVAMAALLVLLLWPPERSSRKRAPRFVLTAHQRKTLLTIQLATASAGLLCTGILLFRATSSLVGKAVYRYDSGTTHAIDLPFFVSSEGKKIDIRFPLTLPALHPNIFRVKPDDCIDSMEIDGKQVDDRIAFCDFGAGKPVDLSPYLRPGVNQVHAVLSDSGGIGGLSFAVSVRDPLALTLGVAALAFAIWAIAIIMLLLPRRFVWPAAPLLFALATVLRWWYVFVTPFNTRGHDTDAHIDYIQFVLRTFRIPLAVDSWEFHQPPLYYFLAAIVAKLSTWAGYTWTAVLGILQGFSLLLSIITYGIALWISTLLIPRQDGRSRLLYGALLAVFPSLVFLASAISNDPLYQCLVIAVVAFLLHWWHTGKWRSWYATVFLIALASLTKVSASAFIPLAFFCLLVRRKVRWRTKFLHGFLGFLLIVVLSGWLPVMRLMEPNPIRTLTLGNDGMNGQLLIPNKPSSFLVFNPVQILKIPYNNPWNDGSRRTYFWEYFFRSAFFGEYDFPGLVRPFAVSTLFFGLLMLPFIVAGFLWSILRRTYALLPIWLLTLLIITSSLSYRFRFPYAPNQDFRFVVVLLIPLAFFAVAGTRLLPDKWKFAGDFLLLALVISCSCFLLLIPFGS